MSGPDRLARAAGVLEYLVLTVAALGLLFRVTVYWRWPEPAAAPYGTADLVDFAWLLALFLLATACAATGVALALTHGKDALTPAYRALVLGITTFVAYYLLLPYLPRLG